MKLSIGEFSLVASISIKALRLYHEKGLLVPSIVDPSSGYRYYDESSLERANSIRVLKQYDIEEKNLDTLLIAGHRMQSRYEEMGRHAAGKPMALYHDGEYKEEGADFEPCIPVSKGKDVEGISIRELKGGRCVSLIHKGNPNNYLTEIQVLFED